MELQNYGYCDSLCQQVKFMHSGSKKFCLKNFKYFQDGLKFIQEICHRHQLIHKFPITSASQILSQHPQFYYLNFHQQQKMLDTSKPLLDRTHLQVLISQQRQLYHKLHPKSSVAYQQANNLLGRVPMTWMNKWAGSFPPYLAKAYGNRIIDLDGCEYVDFALGDTGAMTGHSPDATVEVVVKRIKGDGGMTTMLPTEDAQHVGEQLQKRFGLPLWSFALSATDANRWALRLARLVTKKPKILVFSYSYHGSVDQTFVVIHNGKASSRPGLVAPSIDPTLTTRVCQFNDFEGFKKQLAHGDVAAVLMEPAMTNIGIVIPEPGFLQFVRSQTLKTGTLLINDETHTFSAGYGGATKAMNLKPDMITIGKSMGGGIPCGAFGVTKEIAEKIMNAKKVDLVDVGGIGGTLAGIALSMAAIRVTLEKVLTEEAFERMIKLCTKFTKETKELLEKYNIPWSISQLGARAEYRFVTPAPKNGGQSVEAGDDMLDEFMHLFMLNRGILMTPFHNMALMCPTTTEQDVNKHTKIFEEAMMKLQKVYVRGGKL